MKNCSVRFWSFLFVILFASLLVGCNSELLDYENGDTYALFDRPAMAPPTPAELDHALQIITFNYPMDEVSWAYSTILEFLGVTVEPDAISNATFTVQEIGDMLSDIGVELAPWLPHAGLVDDVLSTAITRYNTPGFDSQSPENVALAALASSLENDEITDPGQINENTQLSHGDLLILLVCIHLSPTADPDENALASVANGILESNNISIAEDLPDLETFVEETTGTEVSVPHQGQSSGGSSG